jgi:hypothetical protein
MQTIIGSKSDSLQKFPKFMESKSRLFFGKNSIAPQQTSFKDLSQNMRYLAVLNKKGALSDSDFLFFSKIAISAFVSMNIEERFNKFFGRF